MSKTYDLESVAQYDIEAFKKRFPDLTYHINKLQFKLKRAGFSIDDLHLFMGKEGKGSLTMSIYVEAEAEEDIAETKALP